MKLFATSGN